MSSKTNRNPYLIGSGISAMVFVFMAAIFSGPAIIKPVAGSASTGHSVFTCPVVSACPAISGINPTQNPPKRTQVMNQVTSGITPETVLGANPSVVFRKPALTVPATPSPIVNALTPVKTLNGSVVLPAKASPGAYVSAVTLTGVVASTPSPSNTPAPVVSSPVPVTKPSPSYTPSPVYTPTDPPTSSEPSPTPTDTIPSPTDTPTPVDPSPSPTDTPTETATPTDTPSDVTPTPTPTVTDNATQTATDQPSPVSSSSSSVSGSAEPTSPDASPSASVSSDG